MEILTFKLNSRGNFATVYAKKKDWPVSYSNTTQATAAASKLTQQGISCRVIGNRPFYVEILTPVKPTQDEKK